MAPVIGVTTAYLVILAAMFSLVELQGLNWALATAGTGLGVGTALFLAIRRVGQEDLMRIAGE
jgi:hypothetical protein